MADSDDKNKMFGTVVLSLLLIGTVFVVMTLMNGNTMNPIIMNCMPNSFTGLKKPANGAGEGFAPINPYFDADQLKPKVSIDDPDWAKKYAEATSGLMGQNYVDNADPRKFSMTRSTCGRRFMSLDLRRVPVPTRDPTTVTSFGLPYIPPECVRQWEDSRPPLDC